MKFAWIQTEKAHYPIRKLCRWLAVTPSGFYAWCTAAGIGARDARSDPRGSRAGVVRREPAAVRQSSDS